MQTRKKWNDLTAKEREQAKSLLYNFLNMSKLRIMRDLSHEYKKVIHNHMAYMKRKLQREFVWDLTGAEVMDCMEVSFSDGRAVYLNYTPMANDRFNEDLITLMEIFTNTQQRTEDAPRPTGSRASVL